jgi:hypothetical protein
MSTCPLSMLFALWNARAKAICVPEDVNTSGCWYTADA